MEFNKVFISLTIVSMVIIGIGLTLGEWNTIYNSGITYDLTEYNKLDNLTVEASTQKDKVVPQDDSIGTGDYEGKILSGAYGLLGRIFSPFTLAFNMLESLENRFSLPSFIAEGLISILIFSMIYALIAIIFKLGRRTV